MITLKPVQACSFDIRLRQSQTDNGAQADKECHAELVEAVLKSQKHDSSFLVFDRLRLTMEFRLTMGSGRQRMSC